MTSGMRSWRSERGSPLSFARNFRYSLTRMSVYNGLFSGMYPTRSRTSSECSMTSSPATWTRPDDAGMNPVRIRIVVLLPAPLGPRKPTISPRCTSNETPLSAVDARVTLRQVFYFDHRLHDSTRQQLDTLVATSSFTSSNGKVRVFLAQRHRHWQGAECSTAESAGSGTNKARTGTVTVPARRALH